MLRMVRIPCPLFADVFGVLIVDCGLLLELVLLIAGTMSSLYSRLQRLVHPFFDAMTTLLMIALSRSRHATKHAPGDKVPCIPIGYRVHAMWFQSIMLLIRIRPSIA